MSTALSIHHRPAARRVVDIVGAVFSRLGEARRWRHTARALHALDDRTLRDIGVRRSDIQFIAEVVARTGACRLRRTPAVVD